MDIGTKGRVLATDSGRAIVQVGGKKITVGVRDDVKIKRGDMVVLAFGSIVAKA